MNSLQGSFSHVEDNGYSVFIDDTDLAEWLVSQVGEYDRENPPTLRISFELVEEVMS